MGFQIPCCPWNSTDIKLFFKARGLKHKRITPLWPRANSLTERFMQNINKCIRTSITSKINWKENLQLMLMCYHNTPHHTTVIAPSILFFNRHPGFILLVLFLTYPQTKKNYLIIDE